MPKQQRVDLNIAPLMIPVAHGRYPGKDMVVLHETVSPNQNGLSDILSVARYLPSRGYGIHGIVDAEGNLAWDVFGETHVLYHTSSTDPHDVSHGVNTRSVGIEQVSRVMLELPDQLHRWRWWMNQDRMIDTVARTLAYLHRTLEIPLEISAGDGPGITTHYQVSKRYAVPGGHVDCWPRHLGGYYPLRRVVMRARQFSKKGY